MTGTAFYPGKIFARQVSNRMVLICVTALGGTIIPLHQHLACAAGWFRAHTEFIGERGSDNQIAGGLHAFRRDSAAGYEGLAGWSDYVVRGELPGE